jgi:hypothetical protein
MICSECRKRIVRTHHLQRTCLSPECKKKHAKNRQRLFARHYYHYQGRCKNGYQVKPRAPKPVWPTVDQILLDNKMRGC